MNEQSKKHYYWFLVAIVVLGLVKVFTVLSFGAMLLTAFACAVLFWAILKGVSKNHKLNAKIEEVDAANRDVIEHNETLMGLEVARKNVVRKKRLEKLGLGD
ncbi:hypothetical protein [Pseudomonas sp. 1 R 17]|uniref:hypothetical protein n=1 Tax=Pseudomonas sp. 1 R 17 TaxID=1844091 RepID=UPI0008125C08|nr:hypothetical protein [Pseudomonas sp. 1 R 17]SAM36053.1 hypothetical protein BN1864_LIB5394:06100 [Pseudomonas sp. 1 R 17]